MEDIVYGLKDYMKKDEKKGMKGERIKGGRRRRVEKGGNVITEAYDRFKGAISGPRDGPSPAVRKFLQENGSKRIISMNVCREPIYKSIDRILNWISAGTYQKNKDRLSYDDTFHLFIVCKLEDSRTVLMEKNHVVNVQWVNFDKRGECLPVALPKDKGLTLKAFFDNGESFQGKGFWNYNPANNNCQVFVLNMLRGSNLVRAGLEEFIKQCGECILTGKTRSIAEALTDIAGRADILLHGNSLLWIRPKRTMRVVE